MASFLPHLFLNNPRGENKKFNPGRIIDPDEKVSNTNPEAYRPQKDRFHNSLVQFKNLQTLRRERRSIIVPDHLEYVKIDFLIVFNDNNDFKTRTRFRSEFGLEAVQYSNFNQTVLFAINDEQKFGQLVEKINLFIASSDQILPAGTKYGIVTIIGDFKFLSTEEILSGEITDSVVLSLVEPIDSIKEQFNRILDHLKMHVEEIRKDSKLQLSTDNFTTLQLRSIARKDLQIIIDNFDIIYKVQSYRTPTIKEGSIGQSELVWDFTIAPPANKVMIGVLDNGVLPIKPLEKIIVDFNLDITDSTNPAPLKPKHHHGTVVSTLAAIGMDYFNTDQKEFLADAFIVPVKILNFNEGTFDPYDIEKAIRECQRKGVKIFNLSVSGPGKNYNSDYSEFAFILDRLAYKYDILIFIATGNLDREDVEAMINDYQSGNNKSLHEYPRHFFNPNKFSDFHNCECSNLCSPAESLNNVTVGAIANNLDDGNKSDITPFKELPAYYTRKHHTNYLGSINGSRVRDGQKNYNINKPDVVMPGGDYLNESSGMMVVGFGTGAKDFYHREAGTSWATPIASNLAAKILGNYPDLNMQSIKALMINSASRLLDEGFFNEVVDEIREEEAQKKYGKRFSDLDKKEKRGIGKVDSELLYQKVAGFGMPSMEEALFSNSKRATLVVQDVISTDTYKVININLPKYLNKSTRKVGLIKLTASLCYKFPPVLNNQLGYNPLHISFNVIRSLESDNPTMTSQIISDRNHQYYAQFYPANTGDEEKDEKNRAISRRQAQGIKKNVESWSEDFFPLGTKPFSNVQQFQMNITPAEIIKVNNQISLVVRCTYKRDLNPHFLEWIKKNPHAFSIAIQISEVPTDELKNEDLYEELKSCNELESIAQVESTEAYLEAEA